MYNVEYILICNRKGFTVDSLNINYKDMVELYYSLEETPFPVCKSHKQLIENIEKFDNAYYLKRFEEFLYEKQSVDDGYSARRIVD